uniref:Nuclear pore complex protein n=1 Tax=Ditylenchus dipsaci TaxID=166011 RepID=A0A915ER37_9BILA
MSLEKDAYEMVLKLMDSEELASNNQNEESFLSKLFTQNQEFRKLATLLHWSEEIAFRNPDGFSRHIAEASHFDNVDNIYAYSTMRGRLSDAKCLLDNVNLSASRAFFKKTARELIPMDDDAITSVDQCIWAALSGSLPTLLSHASTTNDRLWSFLSCAVDSILDNSLLAEHAKGCEEMLLLKNSLDEDVPSDVASIFTEIRNFESNPYYCLFGHLAMGNWTNAVSYIQSYLETSENVLPAHELRFFAHLVLSLKICKMLPSEGPVITVIDKLISMFADVLIGMKLFSLVPSYLIHLSGSNSKSKMLDFLEEIQSEVEQKEVLSLALDVGFQSSELCKDVFQRFKKKNKITGDNDETAKSASEMLRAWKWLTYGGHETIWDSILEANYLLRKLFLYNRIAEAVEFLSVTPEDLSHRVQIAFHQEFEGQNLPTPDRLVDAQHEYNSYILYFAAMTKYGAWLKHVEGSTPELPSKLTDEQWARMDIKKRTEYEFSIQRARDLLQKHIRLSEMLKKKCVELLEKVICCENGWLVAREKDEESPLVEERERAADFVKIRESYFFHVVKTLIDVHERANEPEKVLQIADLLVDPRYNIYKAFSKLDLRRLLNLISKSGAALL